MNHSSYCPRMNCQREISLSKTIYQDPIYMVLRVQTPALIQHFLYIPLRVGFMISGKSMAFSIDLNTRRQYFHHMFESRQYLLIFIYSMKMAQCHTLDKPKIASENNFLQEVKIYMFYVTLYRCQQKGN